MPPDLLNVRDLKGGYGRIPVLFGVDFSVREGELVGILGHNGMGKSTLLRTLMGHVPASGGEIRFANQDITRLAPERRARRGIGYVPQGRQIFPALSVLDNMRVASVHVGAREAKAKIEEIVEELPRLQPILGRLGGVLSGGEQQILALGRCLCASPRLILLDEPTEGIQPSICDEIQEVLRRLSRKYALSIVLVEQDLDFISSLADRILIIRKGRLVDELAPADLHDSTIAGAFVGLGE